MNSLVKIEQTVPNGTLITPRVLHYVERYKVAARKSATAVMELANTLAEANEKLCSDEFAIFCGEAGIDPMGSKYKKLILIAANTPKLKLKQDNLPQAWTTLYKLTTLTGDQFETVSEILHPLITAKEIDDALKAYLPPEDEEETKQIPLLIEVQVNVKSRKELDDLCKTIMQASQSTITDINVPKKVTQYLAAFEQGAAS